MDRESAQGAVGISVKDLRVRYGEREILHGISFDVQPGETLVILGGSGSGKSTLLRTLVGLERVASGRKKTRGDVDAIAQGHVWAGTDAHRLGLVDQLGSFNDALKATARQAHLSDYAPEFLEPELTWAEQLALQLKTRVAISLLHLNFGISPAERSLAQIAQVAQRFDPLTREVARLSRLSVPNHLYAYCFCEVR